MLWSAAKIVDGVETQLLKPTGQFASEGEAMEWVERYEPAVTWDQHGWIGVEDQVWQRTGQAVDGKQVTYRVRPLQLL